LKTNSTLKSLVGLPHTIWFQNVTIEADGIACDEIELLMKNSALLGNENKPRSGCNSTMISCGNGILNFDEIFDW
jgi:hypothetical protein